MANAESNRLGTESIVQGILNSLERDREREIVSRRFGLFDRRETLEQIGELLGITRERVRQLEKSIVSKLKAAADKDLPDMGRVEEVISAHLNALGKVARVQDVAGRLAGDSKTDQARVAF